MLGLVIEASLRRMGTDRPDRKLSIFLKPTEDRDTAIRVHGLGEPWKYIPKYSKGGDIVIEHFHTHVNDLPNPDEIDS
jgi:hypothetical protein